MRLAKIICIILAGALVVCLPLTAYAKPPTSVRLLGVTYGSDETAQTWKTGLIAPVQNNIFGIYSNTTLHLVTEIALYFRIEADSFTSFSLHLRKLSTEITDGSDSSFQTRDCACYTSINPNTGYTLLRPQRIRTINEDGTTDYVWQYVNADGAITGKPYLKVIIPFQNFMISTTPYYFEFVDFFIDGLTADEIEIDQYAQEFQDRLERLEDIEERAYQQGQDIPVTDIQNYLSRTDGDHYFSAFHYMFAQSTLLSTMVTVVCLFGIIGFIIYGKKV